VEVLSEDVLNTNHWKAMQVVRRLEYKGAVAELEHGNYGNPELDGFVLQEKGIIKRMKGDLEGALCDLTAAMESLSRIEEGPKLLYDCWKHRGYVKFLMGDLEGTFYWRDTQVQRRWEQAWR
jgi:hypothetical protein